ncbi:MAG TPA: rod shape-determining protein MreD [Kiritimatiellia bacterium]|nr:rod shape-determining protein MreD [Kiritimatiellia bacterium]
MNQIALIFSLLMAALLQAAVPTTAWTGWAPAPVMAGLVVYYALVHPRGLVLEVALLAGLVEDSLSQMPLGTTSFAYAVAGLVMERYREDVVVRQWTTHVVFGALVNASATVFAMFMLLKDGLIQPPGLHVLLRLAGAFVLGGLIAPFVFKAMENLDATLGHVDVEAG